MIKIKASILANALEKIKGTVSTNSPIQLQECVLFKITGNILTLETTNIDASTVAKVVDFKATTSENIAFCVEHHFLLENIKKYRDAEVELLLENEILTIKMTPNTI